MTELESVDFGEVLMAWALHEWNGRVRPQLPPEAARLSEGDRRFNAAKALLQVRIDVITGLLAAGIKRCARVRIDPADMNALRVMGADPLTNYSRNKRSESDTDGSADYVRRLAASPERVSGPFMAIARSTSGPLTFFDGMHRMAAWVAHVQDGRGYPLEINVVVTERPSPVFELAPQ
jgi:hypothetical protein